MLKKISNCNIQNIGYKAIKKIMIGCSIELIKSELNSNAFSHNDYQKINTLWKNFMNNHYAKINNYVDENIISIEEPITHTKMRKWAAIESHENFSYVNDEINSLIIEGDYYGFIHYGKAIYFEHSYQSAIAYLHKNNIKLDDTKPRFEVMHRSYLPDSESSQEVFWLPIKL